MAIATDDQLQRMMNYCLDFARRSIDEAGEFDPFGAVIDRSGNIEGLMFGYPLGQKTVREIYATAAASMERKFNDGEILAAALVTNIRKPPDLESAFPTGIKFEIETTERSTRLYLPYEITKKIFRRRRVMFGEIVEFPTRQVTSDK